MVTPTDPSQQGTPLPNPDSSNPPPANLPTSYIDPTGTWARFLSTPGHPATEKDVQMFMNTLLRFFSAIIQQQQNAAHRAAEHLKKVEKGEE